MLGPMMGPETTGTPGAVAQPLFATTHWSVVLASADQNSPQGAAALEQLCRTYWYPLYAYVRRRGYQPEDAEDLTQEFFARFLAGNYLARVDRERAKFRSYLLGALNHFLADAWDHAHRIKRGGTQALQTFDVRAAESRYTLEPVEELNPDRLFDRRWALTVLGQVLSRLREEYERSGKGRLFEKLSAFLPVDAEAASYGDLAGELEMTESAVRVAVHRLRRRYGQLFASEVAQTVASPAEIQDEMRYLLAAASS
jgi:RNA polymerase sigma factor (sigma-70 family)